MEFSGFESRAAHHFGWLTGQVAGTGRKPVGARAGMGFECASHPPVWRVNQDGSWTRFESGVYLQGYRGRHSALSATWKVNRDGSRASFEASAHRQGVAIDTSAFRQLETAEVGSSDGLLNRSDPRVSGSMPPVSATPP